MCVCSDVCARGVRGSGSTPFIAIRVEHLLTRLCEDECARTGPSLHAWIVLFVRSSMFPPTEKRIRANRVCCRSAHSRSCVYSFFQAFIHPSIYLHPCICVHTSHTGPGSVAQRFTSFPHSPLPPSGSFPPLSSAAEAQAGLGVGGIAFRSLGGGGGNAAHGGNMHTQTLKNSGKFPFVSGIVYE